jgi:hypothetical protein
MYGVKIEFTDKSQPDYWIKFQKYIDKVSHGAYNTAVSMTYSELQRFNGMLNPYYAYRSGVDTLHFMTKEKHDKFINKWSNYEHIE